MKKLLFLIPVLIAVWFVYQQKTELPKVPFAENCVERLASTLSTNGKVEPLEYSEIRKPASRSSHLTVRQGMKFRRARPWPRSVSRGKEKNLRRQRRAWHRAARIWPRSKRAEDRVNIAEIEGSQSRLRAQREAAQRNLEFGLERLVQANAAQNSKRMRLHGSSHSNSISWFPPNRLIRTGPRRCSVWTREAQANVDLVGSYGSKCREKPDGRSPL